MRSNGEVNPSQKNVARKRRPGWVTEKLGLVGHRDHARPSKPEALSQELRQPPLFCNRMQHVVNDRTLGV